MDTVRLRLTSKSSSGISLNAIRSDSPFAPGSSLGTPEPRLLLNLLTQVTLWRRSVVVRERRFLDVILAVNSRRIGRKIGMHWTMMVPVISDEYLQFLLAMSSKKSMMCRLTKPGTPRYGRNNMRRGYFLHLSSQLEWPQQ